MIKNIKNLDKEQVRKLYEENEWIAYLNDFDNLIEGIKASLDCFTYYLEDELVGLVRTVGDGRTIIYIQDILISPKHQDLGIGSKLINNVTEKYKNVRQIVLMTDSEPKQHHFYEKNGFTKISKWGGVAFTYDRNKKS